MSLRQLKSAISHNDVRELQQIFCTNEHVSLNSFHRYNPLIHACIKGSPVIAGALVKAGADVNVKVPINYFNSRELEVSDTVWNVITYCGTVTPLMLGVIDENLELVRKLVQDCGADVKARNQAGMTLLHLIGSDTTKRKFPRIQQEIVDLLLKAGADVNVQDKDGATPLHCAAIDGNLDYARKLLQNGPRVDLANNEGQTALHIAAHKADTQLLQLLLQQDVSQALINQKTRDDATPLHVAITAEVQQGVHYSYQAAHEKNRNAAVRLLIDNGADLTSQNDGLTPLHLAAEAGYLDIVKMLVEAGADIRAEAPFTCLTPVDMAKHTNRRVVVNYLVAKAAENENKKLKAGRPKRDPPSVEPQQTDTPVEHITEAVEEFPLLNIKGGEDSVEHVEGAVGGFQQLGIKDEDSSTDDDL